MLKKYLKLFLSLLTVVVTMLCNFGNVRADGLSVTSVPIGYYVKYGVSVQNTYGSSKQGSFNFPVGTPLYAIYVNGQLVFCVEPGVALGIGSDYSSVQWNSELQKKIDLVIYYSYYNTAKTSDDLARTILAVQTTANPNFKGGEAHITGFNNWYNNELMPKVNSHRVRASFHNETYTVKVGETLRLTDTNGTLNSSVLRDNGNGTAVIEGNDLVITPTIDSPDSYKVRVRKFNNINSDIYDNFPGTLYISETRQNLYKDNGIDPVNSTVTINVIKLGNIRITKLDRENGKVLSGVEFGLYEKGTDNLIQTGVTDDKGIVEFKDLEPKAFDIKEIRTRDIYRLNNEVYSVTVEPSQTKELVVNNDVKRMNISVSKHLDKGLDNSSTRVAGAGITFNVFSQSTNQQVDTFTTNTQGFGVSNWLRIDDTYRLEEVTPIGYKALSPIQIKPTTEDNKTYHFIIENNVKKSYLKIQKVDANTKEIIKASGVKFQLYKDGKLVKQTVNYPVRQEIDTFETNENGEVTLPEELVYGTYEIKEVEAPKGYYLSKMPVKFEVNGTLDTVIVQFENIKKPTVETVATTQRGGKVGYAFEKHIEKATMKDLEIGQVYTVIATQYDSTGKVFSKQEREFTARAREHEEVFEFDVPVGYVGDIVYGEDLYKDKEKVAIHFDLENKKQTVTVLNPKISTEAFASGQKEFTVGKTVELKDTLTYENFKNEKVIIRTWLVKHGTDEVVGQVIEKVYELDGSGKVTVDLSGVIDTTTLPVGKYTVMEEVFEVVEKDGKEEKGNKISEHVDNKDEKQSITVKELPKPILPQTSDKKATVLSFLGLILFVVGGVIVLLKNTR